MYKKRFFFCVQICSQQLWIEDKSKQREIKCYLQPIKCIDKTQRNRTNIHSDILNYEREKKIDIFCTFYWIEIENKIVSCELKWYTCSQQHIYPKT